MLAILADGVADEVNDEMHFTDDDEQDLRARVDQIPGCRGLGSILAHCGVLTSEQLGTISDKRYHQTLAYIPQKRVDVPGDLQDPKRYGPGHLNSLDELRKQARAEVQARKKAQAPPYNSKSESASSVVTDRQSAKARARSHDGLPSSSTALRVMALPNSGAQQETAAETEAGATIAATIAAAETEAGAGPEAEPSTEALTDATRNAEEKADIHPVAAQNLTSARQLLADTGRGTATAAMALGCISHTLPGIPRNAAHRDTLEAVERNCRDVLVWRCQLRLGPGNIRRRDAFLGELQTAVAEARDAAAAAQSDASSAEAAGDANSWALRGRVAALPFLQQAASGGMPGQKFVSQALHAHRAEVAKRFPGNLLVQLPANGRAPWPYEESAAGATVAARGDAGGRPECICRRGRSLLRCPRVASRWTSRRRGAD